VINIIIPVYNHAEALDRCLSSLCGQTLRPDRVVVVDDGSENNDAELVAKKWQEKLPLNFVRQENKGAPAARNRGYKVILSEVEGYSVNTGGDPSTSLRYTQDDFVIFCDADIVMTPDCLQKMKKTLDKNPDASYAYSSFKFGLKTFECGEFSAEKLKKMPFITSTSLIRVKDFPGWDESLKKFQDWDLWLTMLEQGKVGVWIPEVLMSAKPRKGGMSVWLPSFIHKISWPIFGWMPKEVRKYRDARRVISEKHGLSPS